MSSAVQALLWERWMRTRWVIAGAVGASAMGLGLVRAAERTELLGELTGTELGMCIVLLATLGLMAMLVGTGEGGTLRLGFPTRLFRSPLRTRTAVAAVMGYGMSVIAAYTTLLIIAFFLIEFVPMLARDDVAPSHLLPTLVGLAKTVLAFGLGVAIVFAIVQAWFWTVGGLSSIVALILAPVGLAIAATIVGPLSKPSPALSVWAYAAGIVGPYCIAVAAVSFDRRGGWARLQERMSMLSFARARSAGFDSPTAAHTWYELRHRTYLLPLILLAVVLSLQMLPRTLTSEYNLYWNAPGRMGLLPSLFTTTAPIVALLAGLIRIALNARARQSNTGTFPLTLPVRAQTLAGACLRANLCAVGLSLAILVLGAVFFAATAYAMGDVESVSDLAFWHWENEPYPAWIPPVAVTVFAALAMWSCYSAPFAVIGAMCLLMGAVFSADTLDAAGLLHRRYAQIACIALFPTVIAGAGAWTLWMAHLRDAVSGRAAIAIGVFMVALLSLAVGGCIVAAQPFVIEDLVETFLIAGLALLPAYPLFVTPLLLHRRRHG